MKFLFISGFLLCCTLLAGQQVQAQAAASYTSNGAVNASSNHLEGPSLSTSFILGELVVGNMSGETVQVEHGFHYTHFTITAVEDVKGLALALYPNPTSDELHLRLEEQLQENASIQLLDLNGRLIKRDQMNAGTTTKSIAVSELQSGIYFVKIIDSKGATLSLHQVEKLD